jgi:hypothetical protein
MRERALEEEWVYRTLSNPAWVDTDPSDPNLSRAFAAVPERDGRIMRVVYRVQDSRIVVVTAFLDLGARKP